MPAGPTKVKACKSILFTGGTPEGKIKDWQASTFVGLNPWNPVLDPLAEQHFNKQLHIIYIFYIIYSLFEGPPISQHLKPKLGMALI